MAKNISKQLSSIAILFLFFGLSACNDHSIDSSSSAITVSLSPACVALNSRTDTLTQSNTSVTITDTFYPGEAVAVTYTETGATGANFQAWWNPEPIVILAQPAVDVSGVSPFTPAPNGVTSLTVRLEGTVTGSTNWNVSYQCILSVPTYAYVANYLTNSVTRCVVSQVDGSFSDCVNAAGSSSSVFDGPASIVLNDAQDVLYATNLTNNTVTRCSIKSDGTFETCQDSGNTGAAFDGPNGITFDSLGAIAYVTEIGNNTVTKCPVNDDGSFGACATASSSSAGLAFNTPANIVIPYGGDNAYVTNFGGYVSICPINVADGNFYECADSGNTGASFNTPNGIAINTTATESYVADVGNTTIYECPMAGMGVHFGDCVAGPTLAHPSDLLLNHVGDKLYVTDHNDSTVLKCAINSDNSIGTCVDSGAGATFSQPNGITLLYK